MTLFSSSNHASRWTAELATRTLEPLSPEVRRELDGLPWIAASPDPTLAGAALMARLMSEYANGVAPDEITRRLTEGDKEDGAELQRDVASSLTIASVFAVRAGALPRPRWWEPLLLAQHLAVACARLCLAARGEADELLCRRLFLPESMAADVMSQAGHPAGIDYALEVGSAGRLAGEMQQLIHEAQADPALHQALMRLVEIESREDLKRASYNRELIRVAHRRATIHGHTHLVEILKSEAERFSDACRGLSGLERELMRLVDDKELVVMRAAGLAQHVVALSPGEGPAPLGDMIDGEYRLPGVDPV